VFKKNKKQEYFGFNLESFFDHSPLSYEEESLFSEELTNYLPKDMKEIPLFFSNQNPGTIMSDFNSKNFRCDEFINKHDGMHILFSGCSHTFGTGLKIEDTWAKMLYENISNKTKCSGYFNIGFPGTSLMHQVINTIKYCEKYGNPDAIFFNITELRRLYTLKTDFKGNPIKPFTYNNGFYKLSAQPVLKLLAYQYYYMLEKYCESNNIQLFSFSWKTGHGFNNLNLKTYYKIEDKDLLDHVAEYKKNNPNKLCIEKAMDNQHYGIAYHDFWAKFIYEKFMEKNDSTRD